MDKIKMSFIERYAQYKNDISQHIERYAQYKNDILSQHIECMLN